MVPTGKNIWFDIFREALPEKQQTRKNWSIVKKRGLLALPDLNAKLKTLLRIYRDIQQITRCYDPQLRSTYQGWVIDVKLGDIEMNVTAGGTHHLRGVLLTISDTAEVFLRRTTFTRNEVAIDYLHSHMTSVDIFDGTEKYQQLGVTLLSRTWTCLGSYGDDIHVGRDRIRQNYRKIRLMNYINLIYQFLSEENSDSPLNTVVNLRERYSDISRTFLPDEDIDYLIENQVVTIAKISNPQNNISFEMTVNYDRIPEEFKQRYQAYLHEDKFYKHVTIPDSDFDPSEYENFEIPYGDTTIPITIIDNDYKPECKTVFDTSIFETNHRRILQHAIHQAQTSVDRSVHEPQADHQP